MEVWKWRQSLALWIRIMTWRAAVAPSGAPRQSIAMLFICKASIRDIELCFSPRPAHVLRNLVLFPLRIGVFLEVPHVGAEKVILVLGALWAKSPAARICFNGIRFGGLFWVQRVTCHVSASRRIWTGFLGWNIHAISIIPKNPFT